MEKRPGTCTGVEIVRMILLDKVDYRKFESFLLDQSVRALLAAYVSYVVVGIKCRNDCQRGRAHSS